MFSDCLVGKLPSFSLIPSREKALKTLLNVYGGYENAAVIPLGESQKEGKKFFPPLICQEERIYGDSVCVATQGKKRERQREREAKPPKKDPFMLALSWNKVTREANTVCGEFSHTCTVLYVRVQCSTVQWKLLRTCIVQYCTKVQDTCT